MAKLSELPELTQKVYLELKTDQATSVYALVERLGMSQTTLQTQLTALLKAGWIDVEILHDGAPAGGPCNGYTKKRL